MKHPYVRSFSIVDGKPHDFLEVPEVLDAVADRVLAYRPKPKSGSAKKRQRKRRNLKSRDSNQ